ncbi:protein TIFY 5A-like [Aristolochia californica]|uniref:protein TIFY 5A-like n=1 Tax=Aristolochia californica TaxID=171875 RepID=UPI0035D6EE55
MGRFFNLDLCLLPTGSASSDPASSSDASSPSQELRISRSEITPMESSQQITIFYNGRVCVCDVTEIQARAILCMAKRETEERLRAHSSSPSSPCTTQNTQAQPTGLSMKRSLQRFLQKRKSRIQSTSCPYTQ